MKTLDSLFTELQQKIADDASDSRTVAEFKRGRHHIGKKIIEEAGEVWMAAEYEGKDRTAEEMSQLIYHLEVMMLACGLTPEDIYKYL